MQLPTKNDCPLDGNCFKSGIVYQTVITTPSETFSYIGLTEGKFKTRYGNHKHSFKNPYKKTSTELAKRIWDLIDHSTPYQIAWKIADHGHAATEASKTCDLCTTEKLIILKNRTRTDITPLVCVSLYNEEILRYIKKRKLPINVIFVPGTKLRDILCSSRPLDKPGCSLPHCKICDLLEDDVNCNTSCPVYQITCGLCNELYIGESSRTLHDRLSEHLRCASNPNKPSYKEEALATHYREFHPGTSPSLSFKLLHTERNTIMRKIFEAYIISNLKPNINDKDECIDIKRFLNNA